LRTIGRDERGRGTNFKTGTTFHAAACLGFEGNTDG
jgi:hypothetical protein